MSSTAREVACPPSLADDMQALYDEVHAQIGEADLAHIRNVAAYSRAIKARSRELLQQGGKPEAFRRGVTLHMLHVLLEFSELGHNIMHGCYDHLPDAGEFHSSRWRWDFVTDPREWQVMHHQNHHPFTNIVGMDHDLGYSFLRLKPGQDWFGHHGAQPALIAALMTFHLYYFSIYTATSAARVEGRPVLSRETFRQSLRLMGQHALRNYLKEPLQAGSRALHTLLGNYLGTTLGYDLTIAILLLEHHAENVELFPDPGPDESREQYLRRQLLATTNFTPMPELDRYFRRILAEEVDFPGAPGFEVFYGGLDTHVEHHLFPDLPCNRQRELVPRVREICARHGLPYNVLPLQEVVPDIFTAFVRWALPAGDAEQARPLSLLRRPQELWRRLRHGLRYRVPAPDTYLKAPRFYNVPVLVQGVRREAGGEAVSLSLQRPAGWESVSWPAGAFVSLRLELEGEVLVRQYSLTRDSLDAGTLDIAVKRVAGGRVSQWLNDHAVAGMSLTLVGVPQGSAGFVMTDTPARSLLIAAGAGITPLIAMLRRMVREPVCDVVLLYFNRHENSILFAPELHELARQAGVTLRLFCSQPSSLQRGVMQGRLSRELLQAEVADLAEREVHVCAPPAFVAAAREHLLLLGLPPEQFHTESFTLPEAGPRQSDGKQHRVVFRRSGKEILVDGGTTLLEAARAAGVSVPSGCERGLCRACVCTKLGGQVQQEIDEGVALLRVTACNSLPRSDVELDA